MVEILRHKRGVRTPFSFAKMSVHKEWGIFNSPHPAEGFGGKSTGFRRNHEQDAYAVTRQKPLKKQRNAGFSSLTLTARQLFFTTCQLPDESKRQRDQAAHAADATRSPKYYATPTP
jgi:hypothetical protein